VISSFGKTFHATGWKVGYCLAPANLNAEFRRVHQFTTFTVVTPIQHALAAYLLSDPDFPQQLSAFYQRKRDHFCSLLEGSRFRFSPARSTFFQILDYSDISDQADEVIAKQWTRDIGVASIPVSVFCEKPAGGRHLRFCFAKDDETLALAVEKLRTL
jgi:methionine aminotransferase